MNPAPAASLSLRRTGTTIGVVLLLLLGACATNPPAATGLGDSKASAIEVCMPAGERAYLASLMCPSGQAPTFKRIGSMGSRTDPPKNLSKEQEQQLVEQLLSRRALAPGETDYHVIDAYELSCGEAKRTVYMDMYTPCTLR
eukprot:Opistho-1_new@1698